MTNREWLNEGNRIKDAIRAVRSAIRNAQNKAEAPYGHSFDATGGKIKGHNSSEDKVMLALQYQEKLNELEAEEYRILSDIVEAINQLENSQEKAVLIERYINGKSTKRISREMHYTTRRIQMILKNGENHIRQPNTC